MRLDIVMNINPEKLDYAIKQAGKTNVAYIVMNSKTKGDLAVNNIDVVNWNAGENNTYYATYKGIPIAIYEGRKYGEVELASII